MQIVSTCLARDLPVYRFTYQSLRRHIPRSEIHLITKKEDFPKFREACGPELILWDESELVPQMSLGELREMPLHFFPKGAGWYFQQFLKYAFVNVSNEDEYYLIWDADTVLLRPIEFFTPEGKPFYTTATEHHIPYFETYQALFGTKAERDFSFISQHQVINKIILRDMLSKIESRYPTKKGWAWAIMENLRGDGSNLFSEYETYGHYMKSTYPKTFEVRDLKWTRKGGELAGNPPREKKLEIMGDKFSFAAFEASDSIGRKVYYKLKKIYAVMRAIYSRSQSKIQCFQK
jgi:hypothetical protein